MSLRALADRVGEERVHQPDDRGLLGGALELLEVDLFLVADELDVLALELREHVVDRAAAFVVVVERLRSDASFESTTRTS